MSTFGMIGVGYVRVVGLNGRFLFHKQCVRMRRGED